MNQVLAEKAHMKYLETTSSGLDQYQYLMLQLNNNEEKKILNEREQELERLLANLNVKKIDPNNEADMNILLELSEASTEASVNGTYSIPPGAPDLSALSLQYSIYILDGTRTYKGATHTYRYIRVVDNKGYNGLTLNNTYDAITKNLPASILTSLLTYNFSYGLSAFLGSTPMGLVTDWLLGNVFSVLDGVNATNSTISSTSENTYEISCTSVTEMVYHYFTIPI